MDENEQTETAPRSSFWKRNRKAFLWAGVALAAIIGVVIGVLKFNSYKIRKYDASARSAGRNAKLAEEVWYSDRPANPIPIPYYDNLSDLLKKDKNLTDDPEVTFSFGTCNTSGYTFTTTHKRGSKTFVFTD